MSPPFDGAPALAPDGISDGFLQHQYQVLGIAELLKKDGVDAVILTST